MVNPVIAADGNTYEMSAVVDHIKLKKTSPMDNVTKISVKGLVVNRALKNMIEDFVASPECPADMKEDYEETKKELDMIKAKKLYDEGRVLDAANLGYPETMGVMARNYSLGEGGFNVDKDKAFDFATKAAYAGDSSGQFNLAYCYHKGIGVQQDNAASLTWYQRCVDKGYYLALANNNMGRIYNIGGREVEKDFNKAADHYRIAADLGNAHAQFNLAHMYFDGKGVEQSFTEARKWYKLSADQNNADAQLILGQMILRGQGSDEGDISEGFALIEKASTQNNKAAKEYLAAIRKKF